MNNPISRPQADPGIGPLDEHGQQVWSPEEEAAIARLHGQRWYRLDCEQADADVAAGRMLSMGEVRASKGAMKRKWFADRGITPPPGYSTLEDRLDAVGQSG